MEHTFTLVDTGGLNPDPTDSLVDQVKLQTEEAIEQANAILFVVDMIAGLHPEDIEIAELLRQINKPVLLVANKADNVDLSFDVGEFYMLGLGDPYPVSAIHNIGVAELLDEIVLVVPYEPVEETESEEDPSLHIAVVGRPNAGKSSLFNRLLLDERAIVTAVPGTTRDVLEESLDLDGVPVRLVDTAGLREADDPVER